MPRKSVTALLAQADADLPNNSTQLITAADVRNMVKDITDTYAPGYAAVSIASLLLPALGIAPQLITYNTQIVLTADYAVNLAAGSITRHAGGLAATFNRVSFYAGVAAPNGNEVVFQLYRDGAIVPGGVSVSALGAGNVAQASFSLPTAVADAADHVYDVRATKTSGGADNVTLTNVRFIFEYVPTV
jgi:hypothetical protein